MLKKCKICSIEKPLSEFHKDKGLKDGYNSKCKSCRNEYQKQYWTKRTKTQIQKRKSYKIQHYKTNSKSIKQYNKQYNKDNPDRIKEYTKQYYSIESNKQHHLKYAQKYSKEYFKDPINRVKRNVRNRIWEYLKNRGWDKESSYTKSIGCSSSEFIKHIEGQFDDKMNWANYGDYWEIDHILPLSSAKTIDEVYKLNHYTNLQPLYWKDNREKSDKII